MVFPNGCHVGLRNENHLSPRPENAWTNFGFHLDGGSWAGNVKRMMRHELNLGSDPGHLAVAWGTFF
jgi:hypothetical protein